MRFRRQGGGATREGASFVIVRLRTQDERGVAAAAKAATA
jgi:hypothetical protein